MKVGDALNQAFVLGIHAVTIHGLFRPLDFEKELGFYGAYHQEPMNQLIHFICVPIILWSAFVWCAYADFLGIKMQVLGHRISWATLTFLVYFTYYNLLDPLGGRIYSLVVLAMYISSYILVNSELRQAEKVGPNSKAAKGKGVKLWQLAAFLHVFSWYLQIHPGHGMIEGVKPCLLDSLSQALTVAPLFAFYEGLWFVGFAPELHAQVGIAVAAERARLCETQVGLPFCS